MRRARQSRALISFTIAYITYVRRSCFRCFLVHVHERASAIYPTALSMIRSSFDKLSACKPEAATGLMRLVTCL
jgi:hypothetical protein